MLIVMLAAPFQGNVLGDVEHAAGELLLDRPEKCVEQLHSALLDVMKSGGSCRARYKRLENVIPGLFNFEITCRLVLGRRFRSLSKEKQDKFVKAFEQMSIATYADRFSSYNGEKFFIVGEKPLRKNRVVVQTILRTSDGEDIPLDYTCVEHRGSWRIVAVTAKGVNDLAVKKAEYASFLKKNSMEALCDFLSRQKEKCTGNDNDS